MSNSSLRLLRPLLLAATFGCNAAPADNQTSQAVEVAPRARAGTLAQLAAEAKTRKLSAAFVIVDGVYNTELTAPYDVLEHTLYHAGEGLGIEVSTVSPDGETITTAEGLRILPDYSFSTAPDVDILVVPSAENSRGSDLERKDLIEWIRAAGRNADIVMSLCWGAFVLAEAGLLDGRSCTTFPSDYDTFSERFPNLDLRINISFVHDGHTITSQGGARSFDPAMYLVDKLYGQAVAKGIGRGLLIPWPPAEEELAF